MNWRGLTSCGECACVFSCPRVPRKDSTRPVLRNDLSRPEQEPTASFEILSIAAWPGSQRLYIHTPVILGAADVKWGGGEGDSIPSPVLSSSLPPLTLVDTCAKYLVRVSCTRLTGAHAAHVHTPRLALV
ncbi:hypothetical protein C0Q70_08394 [Pomacea canaliculata]|uniref:Uncharacterized protein n=1 Tax=Pomacea canaliculata TaxID=400727 RepID=A0A2T7PHR5_POMCA|nr:hypothetical protein C0Q70_08394 [Pomacea canaliculata]